MRKYFLFFLTAIFFLSVVSAVNVQIKDKINIGETLLVKVSGNFLDNVQKSDISFYRRYLPTSFSDYDIQKIGEDYYIYAVTTGKSADNYSLQIKNVYYMDGEIVKNTPIIANFTILNNKADFSLTPGVVKTEVAFSVRVQNLQSKTISLSVDNGTTTTYSMISGKIMDLSLDVGSGIRIINFNSANQSYDLTVESPVIAPECAMDEDCATGNVCNNGICVVYNITAPACASDLDCMVGKMCSSGVCVINNSWCSISSDCIDGKICTNQKCVLNSTLPNCTVDSNCTNGTICSDGLCIENSTNFSCIIDEDCEVGNICVGNECILNSTDKNCTTNDNCEEGRLCLANKCVLIVNCSWDADCANGTVCRDGLCIENSSNFSCIIDEECSDGRICVNNSCKTNWSNIICEKDSECGDGRLCINEKCINEDDIIIIDNETGEVKTCAELSGTICVQASQTCSGEKQISDGAECCLGKCIDKASNKSKKIVGWVLIIIIVLIFTWFFLKKYKGTKKKKVDLEKESKGKGLPPMPPVNPKMP